MRPVYKAMRRLKIEYVPKGQGPKPTYQLNKEMINEVYRRCVTLQQASDIIEKEYGIKCNEKAVRNFMARNGMDKEFRDMERRRRLRYLVKGRKMMAFSNLDEVAKYLGLSKSSVVNQVNNRHPKFKVLTWMDRFGGKDR